MSTLAPHTAQDQPVKPDPTDEPAASIIGFIAFCVCLALLLTHKVTGLGIVGTIGFLTIVPGVCGSLGGYLAQGARAAGVHVYKP
jgi:hypothetical protein